MSALPLIGKDTYRMKKALKIVLITVAVLVGGAVILGVLNGLFGDKWSFWTDYTYDDSGYTVGDGSIPAEEIKEIDLDWVDGSVTVVACQDAYASITESSKNELTESALVRWQMSDDGRLSIKYRESSFFLGREKNKEKDLILRIPERFLSDLSIRIHVVSSDVFLDSVVAENVSVESDSGNVAMLSAAAVRSLSVTTKSGKILVSGLVAEELDLTSQKGEIKVESPVLPAKSCIETKDGDIHLLLSPSASFALDFEEEKGKYVSDFDLNEQDGCLVLGDGDAKLNVKTKSGTLYLTEK